MITQLIQFAKVIGISIGLFFGVVLLLLLLSKLFGTKKKRKGG